MQPFLLDFYRVHFVVMEFFVRMYAESGATLADFARVSTLTTSQVRLSLGAGALDYQSTQQQEGVPKSFFALKQEFEQARYEEVRDRQMKELEIEDDLMSKLPVRYVVGRYACKLFNAAEKLLWSWPSGVCATNSTTRVSTLYGLSAFDVYKWEPGSRRLKD